MVDTWKLLYQIFWLLFQNKSSSATYPPSAASSVLHVNKSPGTPHSTAPVNLPSGTAVSGINPPHFNALFFSFMSSVQFCYVPLRQQVICNNYTNEPSNCSFAVLSQFSSHLS